MNEDTMRLQLDLRQTLLQGRILKVPFGVESSGLEGTGQHFQCLCYGFVT
jgi:hypothetical protein